MRLNNDENIKPGLKGVNMDSAFLHNDNHNDDDDNDNDDNDYINNNNNNSLV